MGRYQYKPEDELINDTDGDNNDTNRPSPRGWNFVALPGEEGSLVRHDDTLPSPPNHNYHHAQQVVGSAGQHALDTRYSSDYDDRPRTASCCPLWLRITLLVLGTHMLWYLWSNGPPAPPASSTLQEDELQHESWDEYLQHHTDAFVTSGKELFLNLPYHLLSWWSIHVHSDLYGIYQDWVQPKPCSIEFHHEDTEVVKQRAFDQSFAAQAQPLAWRKVTQALASWTWEMRTQPVAQPLVFLVSTMTPGLQPDNLAQHLANEWPFSSCPHTPMTKISLRKTMDPSVLRGKLISTLTPWRGEGGIVVLSSVEQLSPVSLEWLLGTLTGVPDDVDHAWTASLATRTIFFLTSDEIGRSSLIRHKREGAAAAVPASSLLLDLRHDWREYGARWEQGATILPFFAINREQVKQYALLQLKTMLNEWTTVQLMEDDNVEQLSPPSGKNIVLLVAPTVLDALTGPGIVEYISE